MLQHINCRTIDVLQIVSVVMPPHNRLSTQDLLGGLSVGSQCSKHIVLVSNWSIAHKATNNSPRIAASDDTRCIRVPFKPFTGVCTPTMVIGHRLCEQAVQRTRPNKKQIRTSIAAMHQADFDRNTRQCETEDNAISSNHPFPNFLD